MSAKDDSFSPSTGRPARALAYIFSLFRPPAEHARTRPQDLTYWVNERPPLFQTVVLASQHTVLALAMMVYVLIAAKEVGLDGSATRGLVSVSILVIGLATILQCAPTRFGSGMLLIHTPSAIQLAAWAAIAKVGGVAQAGGALLMAGGLQMACARIIPSLRTIVPPEVIGVVVAMLGLSLVPGGVIRLLGMDGGGMVVHGGQAAIGFATLATVVAIAVWSRGRLRLFALLLGVGVGELLSIFLGSSIPHAEEHQLPAFAIPDFVAPELPSSFSLVVPLLIAALLTSLDTMGGVVVQEKMNDANWRRSDMNRVGRGVSAGGVGSAFGGLFGGFGMGVSSASIGLCSATGTTSRTVGIAAGIFLVLLAFMPQAISVITAIPMPVLGAISVYAGAYLMASGLQLMTSRMLDSRRIFMIGLALSAGVAVLALPQMVSQVPEGLRSILSSPVTTAGLVGVALHGLFRLGSSRTGSMALGPQQGMAEVLAFLEQQGGSWGARRDVVMRAGVAVLEAVETIRGLAGTAPITLKASFDEYALDFELSYRGPMISTSGPKIDLEAAMADDDFDIDQVMASVSSTMIGNLSDRTKVSEAAGISTLSLHFQH